MTIRLRMTLLYSGILSITLLLFGIVLYVFLKFYIFSDLKNTLKEQTDVLQRNVQSQLELYPMGWNLLIQLDDFDSVQSGMYLQITNLVSGYKIKSANLRNVQLPFSTNAPLMLNGELVGVLQSAYNTSVISMFFSILRLVLLILSLIVIFIATYMGWLLSKKALKPVYSLISATEQIRNSEDFGNRIQHNGTQDEIGLLSKTINGMLKRIQSIYGELDNSYSSQRRFVADTSHELRTPLTTITGNAEFLKKIWTSLDNHPSRLPEEEEIRVSVEALNDITDEATRMGRLVNDLLALARADAGFRMKSEVVELKSIVDSVVRKAQLIPKVAELKTEGLDVLENTNVLGDKDYLQELLFIFIDNAFKFTAEGYVEINALRDKDKVGLTIRDTGIGMDPNELPHIFDRFYRADSSRGKTPGTGLGLSIAKWILEEHKGTVDVISGRGKGTSFLIWLPVYNISNVEAQ
ncbi:HAMP domain-containing histidine kinase [Paenibacillus frigoriresistens]|uniref:sensor histidine kinase n=1 Tax=Paenibacillus alginolyticus TaxID=59839 RepID=UPI001566631B|nr:HAMP domain-containing sensor histidine kinase [Paenibacillus frigoriresistens]NRF93071.1 HAMP domain-containing histidine kinase [Paenibacillus frigoriresistens]